MSKASEYVKALNAQPKWAGQTNISCAPRKARVNDQGNCLLTHGDEQIVLIPEEAVSLAMWILDVFAENSLWYHSIPPKD